VSSVLAGFWKAVRSLDWEWNGNLEEGRPGHPANSSAKVLWPTGLWVCFFHLRSGTETPVAPSPT
jgi:hypothetical protein